MCMSHDTYLAVQGVDLVDHGFTTQLYVIAKQNNHTPMIFDLLLVEETAMKNSIIIVRDSHVIQFSLYLEQ